MKMSTELAIILSITAYKISCLVIGSLFCVLGYRLFTLGLFGPAGDLEAKLKDTKITFKSAAPGTFFSTFGAIIIVITLWNGIKYDLQRVMPCGSIAGDKAPLP